MSHITLSGYCSPAGEMIVGSYGDSLCICDWAGCSRTRADIDRICHRLGAELRQGPSEVTARALDELSEYFAGVRRDFTIPVLFAGTDFQRAVWHKLSQIPYGSTISYGELALRMGYPKSIRAVAAAVAANPMSVVVPCHRVVGSDGRLTGYRGGMEAKSLLLSLEAAACGRKLPLQGSQSWLLEVR